VEYTATATKKMSFCGCKASKSGALCDGSHNSL
jgi:CDGSH-type Zn-finger protein